MIRLLTARLSQRSLSRNLSRSPLSTATSVAFKLTPARESAIRALPAAKALLSLIAGCEVSLLNIGLLVRPQ